MPDLKIAGGSVPVAGAGMAAEVAALSPMEIMHRTSQQWLTGATGAEKAETLRVWLRHSNASKSLLRMLEGEMGERVLTMPTNRIPKAIMRAAGSNRGQATFTRLLEMMRHVKPGGASEAEMKWLHGLTVKAARQGGLPANQIDALMKMGPKRVYQHGATSVSRVYDIATKESSARSLLRWATKGDPKLTGKKWLGTGPTQSLAKDIRAQIDELERMAKTTLGEEVSAAKGAFGKAGAAVRGGAARVGEAAAGGLTEAEGGVLKSLKGAGAKGLGRAAKMARGAGGLGALLTVPLLGHEAYDSLVGKSKRARAAMEASRRGGTPSVSQELMYDILDKRYDLQARRANLSRDPQLMQQIVQSLGGDQTRVLTDSEVGLGVDTGQGGASPSEMDEMLDQLLGQMRGL